VQKGLVEAVKEDEEEEDEEPPIDALSSAMERQPSFAQQLSHSAATPSPSGG